MDRSSLFAKLVEENISSLQTLGRTPEPDLVTSGEPNVAQYNRVLNTNMTANYAASLDLMHRAVGERREQALDLCSGPGHLSVSLSKHLEFKNVLGVDLSAPMIRVASENARGLGGVRFQHANILSLDLAPRSFDLISWTNAAHHMPKLENVATVLEACDRLAHEDGTIVLTDVGRLKTQDITERFVSLAGEEYKALGMQDMYDDFLSSMLAAWTADELMSCVPKTSKREWILMSPTGLSSYVALFGLPVGRSKLFLRESLNWESTGLLKSPQAKSDWFVMKQIVDGAEYKRAA